VSRLEGPASLGRDPEYLRQHQYKDPTNLHARVSLHAKYSRAEPWFPWLAERIEWPDNGEVVEVGCGSGLLWANIASLVPPLRLTLTDLSEGMVDAAVAALAGLAGTPGLRITQTRACDAQHLPFADASFDVAVANHMLYHVPDPAAAVAELARVLRPDGVLLAATNGPQHLRAVSEIQAEVYGTSPLRLAGRRFGKANGASILRASFGSVRWDDHPGTLECDDPEDVYAFIASTAVAQESSPQKLHQLRKVIGERFAAGGGMLRTPVESGAFVAGDPRH
jgi:ubiquinone/menaquinone biosynthesis C-methylase UbiE